MKFVDDCSFDVMFRSWCGSIWIFGVLLWEKLSVEAVNVVHWGVLLVILIGDVCRGVELRLERLAEFHAVIRVKRVNDRGDDLRAGFMVTRGSIRAEVRVRGDIIS